MGVSATTAVLLEFLVASLAQPGGGLGLAGVGIGVARCRPAA